MASIQSIKAGCRKVRRPESPLSPRAQDRQGKGELATHGGTGRCSVYLSCFLTFFAPKEDTIVARSQSITYRPHPHPHSLQPLTLSQVMCIGRNYA